LSHEGHPLGHAIVGSAENLARLDELRAGIVRLGDPRRPVPGDSLDQLLETLPAVVWLSASVHGNELSPADAACRLVSWLGADGPGVQRMIRESLIVLIDPLRNPDGRARALAQRRQWHSQQQVDDDQSYHHREAWPGGRGNHYFIDLNRDCWQLSQPETRLRAEEITRWQPQVVLDLHEMRADDTYLFSPPDPPAPSYVARSLPIWWDRFSRAIAKVMSGRGEEYYRGDWHEAFAPARLVAWSLHTGATAMLLEVPGVDGTAVRHPSGATLDFEETVDRHLNATLAVLETAAHHRRELLADFHAFRKEVVSGRHLRREDEAGVPLCGDLGERLTWLEASGQQKTGTCRALRGSATRCVLLPPGGNESRRRRVAEILMRQGIEVMVTESDLTAGKAVDSPGRVEGKRTFPAGSYIVDLHQPLGALAASLLDPAPAVDERSLMAERRRLLEEGQTNFYSYSGWSLLYWADLEAWQVRSAVKGRPLTLAALRAERAAAGEQGRQSRHHALLLNGRDDASLVAALRLMTRGVGLRAAAQPFAAGGRVYAPGSIIIPEGGELPQSEILGICREAGAHPQPVELGLTDAGPDLGSRSVADMRVPTVALLSGFGTSAQALGRLWFLFDRELEWPVVLLPIQRIHSADLGAYSVVVLPDAPGERGPRLREIIGGASWNRLLDWASFGGTLVLCGESIAALPQAEEEEPRVHIGLRRDLMEQVPLLSRRLVEEMRSRVLLEQGARRLPMPRGTGPLAHPVSGSVEPLVAGQRTLWALPEVAAPEELAEWDRDERRFAPRGVLMRVDPPREHWLTSGLSDDPVIPVRTRQVYHALPPARARARFELGRELAASGLLWPEAIRRWEGSAVLIRERAGSGQVIAIAGDFKRGSPVLDRLLLNAVVLGPTLVDQ
jgi:hypothetical protein